MFSKASRKLTTLLQKSVVKDSAWMLSSQGASAIFQLAYFIMLARYLGAENFGYFSGVKAIFAIIFPFVGLGMEDILVRNVSRDQSRFSLDWGTALLGLLLSLGIALVTAFPLTVALIPSVSSLFIFFLFLADLVGLSFCKLAGCAFMSFHQVKQASQYGLIYVILKTIAVFFLPFFPKENILLAWGLLYCVSSIAPGIILLVLVHQKLGKPTFDLKSINISNLKEGLLFSVSASAVTINSEVDRSMLVTLSSPMAAGIYGAGYRFIDMLGMPIIAVLGANYARFFKYGESGIQGTLGFARKLLPPAVLYGIASGAALIIFSPFVPKILGEEYTQASSVLVWFAPLHLLTSLQFLAADTLTGAGFQKSRSIVQVMAAALNVCLNFFLIPLFSWQGAIWATLSSETFRLITLWIIIFFLYRKKVREKNSL